MTMPPPGWTGHLFTLTGSVLAVAILGTAALCLWWLVLDRVPPVTVHGAEVTRAERRPDGSAVVFIRWTGERHRSCPAVSRRWLVDQIVLPLPDIAYPPELSEFPPGPAEWEVAVEVPDYLVGSGAAGLAYRISMEFACNPLQELAFPIRVVPPAVPFVLRPDGTVDAAAPPRG